MHVEFFESKGRMKGCVCLEGPQGGSSEGSAGAKGRGQVSQKTLGVGAGNLSSQGVAERAPSPCWFFR